MSPATMPPRMSAATLMRHRRRRGELLAPRAMLMALAGVLAVLLPTSPPAHAQAGPPAPLPEAPPLKLILTYDGAITDSYTGPVYVVFAVGGPPRLVPRTFGRDPIVAVDVEDWRPDTPLLVDAGNARCAPMDFDQIEPGNYFIQAFLPTSPGSFKPGDVGNFGSRTIPTRAETFQTMPLQLHIEQPLGAMVLGRADERVITESVSSDLLSSFHGTPIEVGYTVVLPPGYFLEPNRWYPSRIWFGTHGSEHRLSANALRPLERFEGGNDIITVLIEVTSRFGHPMFVNSASSGPWERVILEEILPRVESEFRIDPAGRFLAGHAAGAWAAIWLQIAHPDMFQGTFAIAPWPLSFDSWFGVDLYEDENVLVRPDGTPRAYGVLPDGQGAEPAATTWRREDLFVNGGPFRSFEWAFSPPREDGSPTPFFDRRTGVIDRSVIEHWSRWDLTRLIEERGEELAASLDGKFVLRVGGQDGYRLDVPTRRFADALTAAGIGFVDEYMPEKGHGDIAERVYIMGVLKRMADRYIELKGGREALREEAARRAAEAAGAAGAGGGAGAGRGSSAGAPGGADSTRGPGSGGRG